ncbi:Basic 7S globulin [Quillaja saponaria]|uniref:Basic 7S globulin n=1 Tax=Quillaja saponaria TaxID=32244 RepID=A0AAD7LB93_QUISA|nr:Basic 7S globulin [Quillaja saponaria]
MVSSNFHILLFLCSIIFLNISPSINAKISFKPKALVLPVRKDASTNQYIVQLRQRTPLQPKRFAVDLGGPYLWANCDADYVSSSYKAARCGSSQCSLADTKDCRDCFESKSGPGCFNNTCRLYPENTVSGRTLISGVVSQDKLALHSTNGFNPSKFVTLPSFVFVCGSSNLLEDLPKGVIGMAGLGRTKISLPNQFSSSLSNFHNKFAICLTSSTSSNGVIFFGNSSYVFLPGLDLSQQLLYTPLIRNPVTTATSPQKEEPSSEYFIGLTSIKINDKIVSIKKSLLTINSTGFGGTKLSTVTPFTVLEASIYKSFVSVYEKQVGNVPKVAPVAPFELCYKSSSFPRERHGPEVPFIDIVLQGKDVFWRLFGSNVMVQVSKDVLCLGFVKAREDFPPKTPITIGAHQLEDILFEFDLDRSRIGFAGSLLGYRTSCARFNFTSIA